MSLGRQRGPCAKRNAASLCGSPYRSHCVDWAVTCLVPLSLVRCKHLQPAAVFTLLLCRFYKFRRLVPLSLVRCKHLQPAAVFTLLLCRFYKFRQLWKWPWHWWCGFASIHRDRALFRRFGATCCGHLQGHWFGFVGKLEWRRGNKRFGHTGRFGDVHSEDYIGSHYPYPSMKNDLNINDLEMLETGNFCKLYLV